MTNEQNLLRIRAICTAYESGFGQGLDSRTVRNPYETFSDESLAWGYGYDSGYKKRGEVEPTSPHHCETCCCPETGVAENRQAEREGKPRIVNKEGFEALERAFWKSVEVVDEERCWIKGCTKPRGHRGDCAIFL